MIHGVLAALPEIGGLLACGSAEQKLKHAARPKTLAPVGAFLNSRAPRRLITGEQLNQARGWSVQKQDRPPHPKRLLLNPETKAFLMAECMACWRPSRRTFHVFDDVCPNPERNPEMINDVEKIEPTTPDWLNVQQKLNQHDQQLQRHTELLLEAVARLTVVERVALTDTDKHLVETVAMVNGTRS